jgi:hypothetical protein
MKLDVAALPPARTTGLASSKATSMFDLRIVAAELSFATALFNVYRMGEADRLTVAGGTSTIELMANAGQAVARAIERHWSNLARFAAIFPNPAKGAALSPASRM